MAWSSTMWPDIKAAFEALAPEAREEIDKRSRDSKLSARLIRMRDRAMALALVAGAAASAAVAPQGAGAQAQVAAAIPPGPVQRRPSASSANQAGPISTTAWMSSEDAPNNDEVGQATPLPVAIASVCHARCRDRLTQPMTEGRLVSYLSSLPKGSRGRPGGLRGAIKTFTTKAKGMAARADPDDEFPKAVKYNMQWA